MKAEKKFWKFQATSKKTEAELLLYGPISEDSWWGDEITPKQFADDLKAMGDINALTVRINSGGGDVFAGQAIHSILKSHPAEVTVYVDGLAASIASVIAMAGDTVIMPRNAMMMVHNPWTIAIGNANEFRKMAEDLDKITESLIAAYMEKTGDKLNRDKLIELLDAETWLTADEALEYGLIDQVDNQKQVAASLKGQQLLVNGLEFDLSKYQNRPKVEKQLKNKTEEEFDLELTAETLAQKYPELYAQVRKQAFDDGVAAGLKDERGRFKALQELEAPGCEAILDKARYETGQTAEQVAVQIVNVLRGQPSSILSAAINDAAALQGINPAAPPANDQAEQQAAAEKMAKAANKRRGVR